MSRHDDWMQRLQPGEFDQLLNGPLSYRALFKPANLCPCSARGGGADPACPNCAGLGYTWDEPGEEAHTASFYAGSRSRPERLPHAPPLTLLSVSVDGAPSLPPAELGVSLDADGNLTTPFALGTPYKVNYSARVQVRVHAQAFKQSRAWLDRGQLKTGDLEVSIPHRLPDLLRENPAWHAKEHDVFVFPDQRIRYQQRFEGKGKPTLTYRLVRELRTARALVGGALVTYQPGEDFTVTDGQVAWLTAPPPGAYVLEYDAAPEAYVFAELPQTRHIDGHPLPRRVGLRRFELYPHQRR